MYVVGSLDRLEFLDDNKISDVQRLNAKSHIGAYTMSGGPMKFMERFAGASNLLTFFKYDQNKPLTRQIISNTVTANKNSHVKSTPSTSKGYARGDLDWLSLISSYLIIISTDLIFKINMFTLIFLQRIYLELLALYIIERYCTCNDCWVLWNYVTTIGSDCWIK